MTCRVNGEAYKYSVPFDHQHHKMTRDSTSSTNMPKKPIIVLDCDGVLLDSRLTFAQIYERTFGKQLQLVEPRAYRVSQIDHSLRSHSFTSHCSAKNDMV